MGVLRRTHVLPETGESLPYALYVPRAAAKSDKPMPLLLALHGLAYTYDWAVGLENLVDYAEANGMLIVSPLGYSEGGWYGAPDLTEGGARSEETRLSEADVWRVLQLAMKEYRIDPRRVYAWGFSMGGGGALHLARNAQRPFAPLGWSLLLSASHLAARTTVASAVLQGRGRRSARARAPQCGGGLRHARPAHRCGHHARIDRRPRGGGRGRVRERRGGGRAARLRGARRRREAGAYARCDAAVSCLIGCSRRCMFN